MNFNEYVPAEHFKKFVIYRKGSGYKNREIEDRKRRLWEFANLALIKALEAYWSGDMSTYRVNKAKAMEMSQAARDL